MGTRVALALCVVASCTLIGKSLAGKARRRVTALKQIADGLRNLRVNVVTMFIPMRDSLLRTDCPLLNMIGERMGEGMSAGEAWMACKPAARRNGGICDALTAADFRILDGVFVKLGQSERETQDNLLSESLRELERSVDAARAKADEADRLYVTLGRLVGLMLALIVI